MMSNLLRTSAAAAFLVSAAMVADAQQPARPGQAQPPARVQAQPVDPNAPATATYRAKEILGSKIMIQNNTAIGTVDDIVFDSAGNLEYLVVVERRQDGLGALGSRTLRREESDGGGECHARGLEDHPDVHRHHLSPVLYPNLPDHDLQVLRFDAARTSPHRTHRASIDAVVGETRGAGTLCVPALSFGGTNQG